MDGKVMTQFQDPRPEDLREWIIDAVRAVREASPDCRILVDANDRYTCVDFHRFLADVADGNIVCIEGIPGTSTALDYAHYPIVDGQVQVPDLPGFAMPLKEE